MQSINNRKNPSSGEVPEKKHKQAFLFPISAVIS